MRRAFISALLLTSLAATKADYTIVQKTEGAMNAGELTLRIRGDKARIDVGPQLTVLTDLTSGDSTTLNHQAKTMVKVSGVEAAKMRAVTAGIKSDSEPPKLTSTGRSEKIENYDCEVFTWKVGELSVTDWIAKSYPNWQPLLAELQRFQNAGLASAAQPLMPPLSQFPGMVVKREMNHRGTKTTSTLTSVSAQVLDPSLFEAPSGYKEQPAPQLPEAGK